MVLSLPRSGSSAVAGALHKMGINMGEGFLQVPDASNSKGYYEDTRWQALNKALAGAGYSARRVWTLSDRRASQYRELAQLCSQDDMWGAKGPRMAYTFHLVAPVVSECAEVRVVWVHREWSEVVASMVKHSNTAYDKSRKMTAGQAGRLLGVWNKALVHSLRSFEGPEFLVQYDELLEAPDDVLGLLAEFCFDGLPMPDLTEAIEWVDAGMRHHLSLSPR